MPSSSQAQPVRVFHPSQIVRISWVARDTIIVVENSARGLEMEQLTAEPDKLKKLIAQLRAANRNIEIT